MSFTDGGLAHTGLCVCVWKTSLQKDFIRHRAMCDCIRAFSVSADPWGPALTVGVSSRVR